MTEDEVVGWHHRLNGHESERAPGDSGGQKSLVCCRLWGHKETDTTVRLNNNGPPSEPRGWRKRSRADATLSTGQLYASCPGMSRGWHLL